MQYKCRVEVIDKKLFPDLQELYLADPESGKCPFYHIGDVTIFERYGGEDTFWTEAKGAHCAEAWDCISRYIYTALQGGSIMRGWTNDDRLMIACCNDVLSVKLKQGMMSELKEIENGRGFESSQIKRGRTVRIKEQRLCGQE